MTNEEASKIIKAYKQRLENTCSNKLDEDINAFDLAIKALEEERPQGDLISREALKETLSKRLWFVSSPECDAQEIKDIIDNAPTIKTFTLEDIEEQYRKGLEKGLSEWETERPQGEWITISKSTYPQVEPDIYECSICHKQKWHCKTNFCPNCGAEMVGGES